MEENDKMRSFIISTHRLILLVLFLTKKGETGDKCNMHE
jgi:hypothetical protein